MAQVGHEYLEDKRQKLNAADADNMRREYQRLGYADSWIDLRLQGKIIRDNLTQEWQERGIEESREVAILTDVMHRLTYDVSTAQHRKIKRIGAGRELRDSLTRMETLLKGVSEETAIGLHQAHDSQGFDELQADAREAGRFAGDIRRQYEAMTGRKVVSPENYKTLRQGRQRELQAPLFADEESEATPED